ncbi:MAG: hypothetical protein ABIK09_07215 [Pseudomonadota bacterium]
MVLDILYWLFSLVWVIVLPTYFTQRIFLENVESPAGRAGLSLVAVLVLLPMACFGLASLMRLPVNEFVIFTVATAFNLFGMFKRAATYRRRMRREE